MERVYNLPNAAQGASLNPFVPATLIALTVCLSACSAAPGTPEDTPNVNTIVAVTTRDAVEAPTDEATLDDTSGVDDAAMIAQAPPVDPSPPVKRPPRREPEPCGTSEECTERPDGVCVNTSPQGCRGMRVKPSYQCRYDECGSDDDCGDYPMGACLPRVGSIRPYAQCAYGGCREDTDCDEKPGGACLRLIIHCTDVIECAYDTSECRTSKDCPEDSMGPMYCDLTDGVTQCRQSPKYQ